MKKLFSLLFAVILLIAISPGNQARAGDLTPGKFEIVQTADIPVLASAEVVNPVYTSFEYRQGNVEEFSCVSYAEKPSDVWIKPYFQPQKVYLLNTIADNYRSQYQGNIECPPNSIQGSGANKILINKNFPANVRSKHLFALLE